MRDSRGSRTQSARCSKSSESDGEDDRGDGNSLRRIHCLINEDLVRKFEVECGLVLK